MRLAIIPARGGSKRIGGKNIKEFCGQPILAYSIQAARACKAIDAVWVSTEDHAVAAVARQYGASVPFIRPRELADDHTILQDVMTHALEFAQQNNVDVSHACLVFATAPMMAPCDMERGWDVLCNSGADIALSVAEFRSAPQRSQYIDDQGYLHYTAPEYCNVRSQDLKPLYHDAAQFVWGKPEAFMHSPVTVVNVAPVNINANRVVDIDTPVDWEYAESLYQIYSTQAVSDSARTSIMKSGE